MHTEMKTTQNNLAGESMCWRTYSGFQNWLLSMNFAEDIETKWVSKRFSANGTRIGELYE